MFSRREFILGAFERNIEEKDTNESALLEDEDIQEPNWHTFSGLNEYGNTLLIDEEEDIQEESTLRMKKTI